MGDCLVTYRIYYAIVVIYDSGGNILTKTEYPNATATGEGTVISYTYGDVQWGDLLTSYNGNAITYDGSGNPLSMNGWNFTWQGGRQLAGMTNGTTTLSFEYNDSGLRTTKTVDGVVHTYTYRGSTLVSDITATDEMYFNYDQNGSLVGMTYDTATTTGKFYFVKNLQGDIIGILNSSGKLLASYTYDAWGNVLSAVNHDDPLDLAHRNPLRYRGYVYDSETELYYLQSRYYDPEIGRFLNADSYAQTYETVVGSNMFAYCGNNPVKCADDGGEWANIVIGAVVGAAVAGLTTYLETGDVKASIISGVGGAISGGVAATGMHVLAQATIAACGSVLCDVSTQLFCENKSLETVDYGKALYNGALTFGTSLLGSALGGITSSGYSSTGNKMINASRLKSEAANTRSVIGRSSSALKRQSDKLLAKGKYYTNIGYGISSVTGTLLTWGVYQEYKY